jgi:hypothetical protein
MSKVKVAFSFNGDGKTGYIGQPFWPELNTLINIMKDVHPKLGDAKKQQAIQASCEKQGVSPEEFLRIQAKVETQHFYTKGDSPLSEIIIPERQIQSFLNHASMKAPKAIPTIKEKGLTFIGVRVVDGYLTTGKTEAGASKFERFVVLEGSNQRTFSSSPFIHNFSAEGVLSVDEQIIRLADLCKLCEWGGQWLGIGGARPQGFGRFQVTLWEVL